MFRKLCDYHRIEIGQDGATYLQIHGSVSEQIESPDGETIEYRFLTPYQNSKLSFCDVGCFTAWVEEKSRQKPFVQRKLIHSSDID